MSILLFRVSTNHFWSLARFSSTDSVVLLFTFIFYLLSFILISHLLTLFASLSGNLLVTLVLLCCIKKQDYPVNKYKHQTLINLCKELLITTELLFNYYLITIQYLSNVYRIYPVANSGRSISSRIQFGSTFRLRLSVTSLSCPDICLQVKHKITRSHNLTHMPLMRFCCAKRSRS